MAAPRTSGPMIAWITTDLEALDDPDRDIEPVTVALAARGVGVEPVRWRASPDPDWSRFTCAVIRSPWDYPEHLETFASWLESVEAALPVFNEPDTIRWNLDKSYLPELEQAGVPIVPTALCDSGTGVRDEFQRLWSAGHARVVVKPNISAGSRDTGLFAIDDPAAQRLAEHIVVSRRRVVVQPEIPSVVPTDGFDSDAGGLALGGLLLAGIAAGGVVVTRRRTAQD